jgi:U3 small nucleolar RNA-associated protein 19
MPASLHSLPPPSKRRKIRGDGTENAISIKKLEGEIISAIDNDSSLNPLADMLALLFDLENPHDTSKGIYALYRVFVSIIVSKKLSPGGDEAAKVVKTWLWELLMSYIDFLGGLLQDEEKFLRVFLLQVYLDCYSD